MTDFNPLLSIFPLLTVGILLFLRHRNVPKSNFPPGPSPIPILGNIHQIPLTKSFLRFTEWAREYGPIVGIQLGPQRAVILNSWTAVRDLLDQRGAIYSSRPSIPVVQHMGLAHLHPAFLKYDKDWRRARKSMAEFLKDSEVDKRVQVQNAETTQMVWEIMKDPENYRDHMKRQFAAVIFATVYGRRGKNAEANRFFEIQDEWAGILDQGATPPFDALPFLKYVPDWLTPWRGWCQRAEATKKKQSEQYRELRQHAKERVAEGKAEDSFVAKLLKEQEKEGYTDVELEYVAGFMLEAGADTSALAVLTFILAMAVFPDLQKRAQEEVDAAFGDERMPHDIDAEKLPYLKACFWETLRWRPGLPLAIPHAITKDDTYQGYFVAANTTVIMNTWAISHDPFDYPNPDSFDPTRFLGSKYGTSNTSPSDSDTDVWRRTSYAFGAGRRVCAGQRMAENSMLIAMAKLMWAFQIDPVGAREHIDLSIQTGFRDAILTGPEEVGIKFQVRGGDERRKVVEREWKVADAWLSRFE